MISNFRTAFTDVTGTQSAPADTAVPDSDLAATVANGIRGTQFLIECQLYGTSGTLTATIDLYMWDPITPRWAKTGTSISLSSTSTSAVPAARTVYALDSIVPYAGLLPVISAISGTGAKCSVRMCNNGP